MVEQERRAALAEAEEARAQLRLLAEATTQMTGALDVADACARLARIAGARSWPTCARSTCSTDPGAGPRRRLAVAARDAADEELLRELGALRTLRPGRRSATPAGCSTAAARCSSRSCPSAAAERYPDDPAAAASFDAAAAAVGDGRAGAGPRAGARRAHAAHPAPLRPPLRPARPAPGRRLAGRAGLAVDNARLYETEHAAAVTLQRSLLPAVPGRRRPAGRRPVPGRRGRQPGRRRLVRRAARCPTARSASRSATSSGTTCAPPRRWGSCAVSCAPTPGTAAGPARCSTAATSSCRAWRWRRWPPPSTPGSTAGPDGDPDCCATRTPATPRRCCSTPDGELRAARRAPLADDRRRAASRHGAPGRGGRDASGARRARCCCSTPTG